MTYDIKPYSYEQAKRLGVIIYPSDNPKYKIEMYNAKDGMFLGYGGATGYSDYPTYTKTHGIEYANKRRDAYWKRHAKNACKEGTKGYLVARILW